ncbi:hypothetical protein [Sulfuricaulis sp.]|uniref:hypothetical protein n=1 Tax=Sulfuricaulis sp. TaxID=2003553 RepID=UPI0025E845D7|nr:hypothetical protein [Sulfuricaulis sp.]
MLGLFVAENVQAITIPALPVIPSSIAVAHPALVTKREALLTERKALYKQTADHNKLCSAVEAGSSAEASCTSAYAPLEKLITSHVVASEEFISLLAGYVEALEKYIKPMNALAKRLKWSVDEQARLDKALNKLDFDRDPKATNELIRSTWKDVLARGQGEEFARAASKGDGPGFPGPSAGEQTFNQDCAIFALANAASLPYGVVAARATKLLREGGWRPASERANPQAVIERSGLMGGEVVMLAEAFGQVEVVSKANFAKTLKEGRPVMISVVPNGADLRGAGHEVVLTKTFKHGGETWYEMMDSNQSALRRLYLSSKELNTMLKENGVAYHKEDGTAYRPESKTTPRLLRNGDNNNGHPVSSK